MIIKSSYRRPWLFIAGPLRILGWGVEVKVRNTGCYHCVPLTLTSTTDSYFSLALIIVSGTLILSVLLSVTELHCLCTGGRRKSPNHAQSTHPDDVWEPLPMDSSYPRPSNPSIPVVLPPALARELLCGTMTPSSLWRS